ncbi:MAG: hypothetical protein LQ340_007491 [Diploschistes diacapsis]|nr:MAG: hypothetical protein LQ340_007491 [Diploschistes diacapsis]
MLLKKVYQLTALQISIERFDWSDRLRGLFVLPAENSTQMKQMLINLPLFGKSSSEYIEIAFLEANYFTRRLYQSRSDIFPRAQMPMTTDKYLPYIPIIWTICNGKFGQSLSPETLWEMIYLSMLNYQIDEYMETVVLRLSKSELRSLVFRIQDGCGINDCYVSLLGLELLGGIREASSGPFFPDRNNGSPTSELLSKTCSTISTYIEHILQHPVVLRAPSWIRTNLAVELYNFLLAHLIQNVDNERLRASKKSGTQSRHKSRACLSQNDYFKWVRSTAADNTSCPFSFLFFICLVGKSDESTFERPQSRYLSQGLARHLATMCRQYNDYGSSARDTEEGNLNSLDFAEFFENSSEQLDSKPHFEFDIHSAEAEAPADNKIEIEEAEALNSVQAMKEELMAIAEFERGCMELALERLGAVIERPGITKSIRVFIDVTDLFGQIYVQKDIASRLSHRHKALCGRRNVILFFIFDCCETSIFMRVK